MFTSLAGIRTICTCPFVFCIFAPDINDTARGCRTNDMRQPLFYERNERTLLNRLESLLQIFDDVIDVFRTDGQADGVGFDAGIQ